MGKLGLFEEELQFNANRLAGDVDHANDMGSALHESQAADMMHDAMRGDVYLALLGAVKQDSAQVSAAQRDLQQHAALFNKSLTALLALPVSADIKALVGNTLPLVKKYADSAAEVQKLALTDATAAQAAVPAFQKVFEEMESLMEAQSSAIERSRENLSAQAEARVDQTRLQLGLALGFVSVALTLAALWLARHMTEPMAHAVSIADHLSEGDLSLPVVPSGNTETVQLLTAMARMQVSFGTMVQSVKRGAECVATASVEIAQGNTHAVVTFRKSSIIIWLI